MNQYTMDLPGPVFRCGELARVPMDVHRFAAFATSNVVVAMVFERAPSLPR